MRTATDREMFHIRLLQAGMLLALVFIVIMLWRLQVERGQHYKVDASRQSIRRVRLPGTRGCIYDRHGNPLVENRPGYGIVIYLEELRQPGAWSNTIDRVMRVVNTVSSRIGMESPLDREDVWTHIRKRLPLPLHGWTDMDAESLARWAELTTGIPGIDIYTQPMRTYPHGKNAAHLLGYVGRADPEGDTGERYDYYLPEYTGKSGIERSFDEYLRGEAGGYLVRVDVTGYRYEDENLKERRREPKDGEDVQLALDLNVQEAAEKALGDVTGAMVVIDPRNGDVLAFANSPTYNPNKFVPSIPLSEWRRLREDERKPLFNRASQGGYAPGSTFKPVVAMAALENNLARPETRFTCNGVFKLGRARFHCWYDPGHGEIDMRNALKHSCNIYFYKLGLQTGYEYIYHMARALGFGQDTGISIAERDGLLPSEEWKRNRYNDSWRKGDTCNLSIGQGALVTTPLRMAVTCAAIANGGIVYRPRAVLGIGDPNTDDYEPVPVEVANDLHWHKDNITAVREGMRRVVMGRRGTGRRARVDGVEIAGKTGTAEYGPRDNRKNNTWMIAFAPFDHPRYAVAALVEDGDSGGSTVAPRISDFFEKVFKDIEQRGGRG